MSPSGHNVCADCGYDFAGTDFTRDSNCPECGRPARSRFEPRFTLPNAPPRDNLLVGVAILLDVVMLGVAITLPIAASATVVLVLLVSLFGIHRASGGARTDADQRRAELTAIAPALFLIAALIVAKFWPK